MSHSQNNPTRNKRQPVSDQERGAVGLHRVVRVLTPFQTKLVETLKGKYALNGNMSTSELAWRNNTSRLAVWSAMRSLEAQKLAGYFRHGADRWAVSMWYLRDELKHPNAELTDSSGQKP